MGNLSVSGTRESPVQFLVEVHFPLPPPQKKKGAQRKEQQTKKLAARSITFSETGAVEDKDLPVSSD